jgi:hypothetical protein
MSAAHANWYLGGVETRVDGERQQKGEDAPREQIGVKPKLLARLEHLSRERLRKGETAASE